MKQFPCGVIDREPISKNTDPNLALSESRGQLFHRTICQNNLSKLLPGKNEWRDEADRIEAFPSAFAAAPALNYYRQQSNAFSIAYLQDLRSAILACPYFAINNLNRDFVNTKGFSVVFQRSHLEAVERQFPFFKPYLDQALLPACNAFYLNPLLLQQGSRVDPHIDRSLRSYCKTIEPPAVVSVLYVQVPTPMQGGELILRNHRQQVGQIKPQTNTLVHFQGDLTHAVNAVTVPGTRLSLVCEQYSLTDSELRDIPELAIESRAAQPQTVSRSASKSRKLKR